jgi:hypothetical protein
MFHEDASFSPRSFAVGLMPRSLLRLGCMQERLYAAMLVEIAG